MQTRIEMMKAKVISSMFTVLMFSGFAQAQVCDEQIKMTTPQSRFSINAQAQTLTDLRTGLTWQRCPAGYVVDHRATDTLTDDRCVKNGVDLYTWQEALQAAETFNISSGESGWRLPDIKELLSIVEYGCRSPAVNANLFPDTPVGEYWSSSVPHNASGVFTIDFSSGASYTNQFDEAAKVRLVR
jgi:hypothetical protein